MLSGEEILKLPIYIRWPYYSEEEGMNLFPFKSLCMILTFTMLLLASAIVRFCKLDHIGRKSDFTITEKSQNQSKAGETNQAYL